MEHITAYQVLLSVCSMVVLSYIFTQIHRFTRLPSVLLLLATGMGLRWLATHYGLPFQVPPSAVE